MGDPTGKKEPPISRETVKTHAPDCGIFAP